MSTVDLTGKLGLAEKPKIKIGDVELVINNSASSILQIMASLGGDTVDPKNIVEALDLLFEPKSKKALDKMSLSFEDLTLVINTAVELIVGEVGEAETLGTTS